MPQRILVVDDNEPILGLFRDLLGSEGYTVLTARGPFTDLNAITQTPPDLIVLDYVFGGQPLGEMLLQQFKRHPTTATIPVIICSAAAKTMETSAPAFKRYGVEVVRKPFLVDDFLQAVRRALATPGVAA